MFLFRHWPAAGFTDTETAGCGVRQSYTRIGKFALIQHQRYAHAKQFKRANKGIAQAQDYPGRVIRDIARKLASSTSYGRRDHDYRHYG